MDDEEEILEMLDISLADRGFAVSVATSASEALKKIRSEHFDLVISDINMPDMSGLELLRAVRIKGNELPFILITGLPDFSIVESYMEKGACEYIHKPFSLDDLLKKIGFFLEVL